MKVSRKWLQKFFEKPLPSTDVIDDALTFHAFEIEDCSGDIIDVDVLPNRSADCLSHRGIAKEISAIQDTPLSKDPLHEDVPMYKKTDMLSVTIEDPKICLRYMGAIVQNIKVKKSPTWLCEALESVGQRSINNIVDATNYVMLNIGQPLHAFDADKLTKKDDAYHIAVRGAHADEKITTLTGEKYNLPENTLLITDGVADMPLGIAGIKGGDVAQIDESTTSLVVESANFDGSTIRRTAQKICIMTDASARFQNKPSPKLVEYGMRDVLQLILDIAGGTIIGVTDIYPKQPDTVSVSLALSHLNEVLGIVLKSEEVMSIFERLGLPTKIDGDTFIVTPPFERMDISIPEDLIEEVVRIYGYDNIIGKNLPDKIDTVENKKFNGTERIKDFLVEQGFTEISTRSFSKKGEIMLANPFDKTKPMLHTTLTQNMSVALTQAKQYAPRVFSPKSNIKLFEIGKVFTKKDENTALVLSEEVSELNELLDYKEEPVRKESIVEYILSSDRLVSLGKDYMPKQYEIAGSYKPYSSYPFMLRDISVWTPEGTQTKDVEETIRKNAGELLVRIDQFDSFTKDGRTSLAFRLVFESLERTLTDELVNTHMNKVTVALNGVSGYEVR